MNDWAEIIKHISVKQRIFALFILLLFPTITFLGGKMLDNNDCREVINENKLLHNDFVEISKLIRIQRRNEIIALNEKNMTMKSSNETVFSQDSTMVYMDENLNDDVLEDILKIVDKRK